MLSASQKKYLRGLAHHLNPSVRVGKKGVVDSLIQSVDSQLKAHELIKVKFVNWKDQKDSLSDQIATQTLSEKVGGVGNITIFYRENSDLEKRKIAIP
jgi:RNA-binding protein